MEANFYAGELAAALFYLFAGSRLARLGRQTGKRPEWLLAGLFLANGASYVLYTIPLIWEHPASWAPLNFAGRISPRRSCWRPSLARSSAETPPGPPGSRAP